MLGSISFTMEEGNDDDDACVVRSSMAFRIRYSKQKVDLSHPYIDDYYKGPGKVVWLSMRKTKQKSRGKIYKFRNTKLCFIVRKGERTQE